MVLVNFFEVGARFSMINPHFLFFFFRAHFFLSGAFKIFLGRSHLFDQYNPLKNIKTLHLQLPLQHPLYTKLYNPL